MKAEDFLGIRYSSSCRRRFYRSVASHRPQGKTFSNDVGQDIPVEGPVGAHPVQHPPRSPRCRCNIFLLPSSVAHRCPTSFDKPVKAYRFDKRWSQYLVVTAGINSQEQRKYTLSEQVSLHKICAGSAYMAYFHPFLQMIGLDG